MVEKRAGRFHFALTQLRIQDSWHQLVDAVEHEGIRRPDKREESSSSSYSRPETRCMCEARMKISLTNGLYCIYEFEPEHNHILATSSQVHHLRSQRKITAAQLASVENAKAVGISNKATFDLMAKEAGGVENLGFTREDMKNKLYSKRSLQTNHGDTGGVLEYLEKKTSEDGKFFYSIQVDEDDLITNIFWTDSKMVTDYEVFGDVEKSLKIRADSDVGTLSHPQATEEEDQAIKPKGLKVKEKEIHGSERPIGGFEKSTRQKKKTKNDPMTSGSATEANTRRKKKGKNDPQASGPVVEVDNVTYEQLHYTDLGHSGSTMCQNQIQIPGYYPGYYPHGNAFVPPPFSSFFGTPNHGQDTQQGNVTQLFNTNPYNMFANFK